jgi:hypothetical protein
MVIVLVLTSIATSALSTISAMLVLDAGIPLLLLAWWLGGMTGVAAVLALVLGREALHPEAEADACDWTLPREAQNHHRTIGAPNV